ncbi:MULTISPECIES: selenocysteine-specific translation elongation factor [unclassified Bacillus (in: firmicutes)]|uniref:selenocysteine-specific translation elongation factor n=1 Tax=unclassified Bacillus (in: firmicutes) TaxID=185979 RepID=UPI0008F44FFE|nr:MULTISPECIES: selenocysteine-specific translation elongation factor [unclassified Bacillus (in: firmicutes)]SFA71849.1 selenocysteine-specific translation elongation factor SelB [Bacillus sp. UNCCL13]SFQ62153.1 selenocysteine-specific translation elongation factor SelB [Bacillus sp. cl95]
MEKRFFTIGMAGHIDHGKTTLTKSLTNVDTDRLKEEKERQISIELGFAPLYEDNEIQISVIDVPGHERFIRQMIAGVAGIDLVVLVVAADEGVMPQTREHLDILGFLGIKNGIVAITKIDRVEEEFIDLVKEDIYGELEGTVFERAPFVLVDSLSGKGTEELKKLIISELSEQNMRDVKGAFRLPIDQVFSVKGQGTVVRGTVYEGMVEEGQSLMIMPKGLEVRARQLQVHHLPAQKAHAGQRVAINLSGVAKDDLVRGDVLVSSEHFIVTKTMDVAIRVVEDLDYMVKQRMPIKLHLGTAEVMGRIVFFDRNELKEENEEILCQLRLDEEILTKRGDRFIIRRPSPQETIGGGWVIDPRGDKYRFGLQTVEELEKKKAGTPIERMNAALMEAKSLTLNELMKRTALDEETLRTNLKNEEFVMFNGKEYTLLTLISELKTDIGNRLAEFHEAQPMKPGMNKAELIQSMSKDFPRALLEYVVEKGILEEDFKRKEQFVGKAEFQPHVPKSWQKRTENMLSKLKDDGLKVLYFKEYLTNAGIPETLISDMKRFLETSGMIVPLDDQYFYHVEPFNNAVERLRQKTGAEFEVGEAKDVLELSRKYIIPFLERLDEKGITNRVENKRIWQ